MRNFEKGLTLKRSAVVITISVFFIALVVYGATTISNNISTGGTLTVTGLTTLGAATSTSATTTAYLYVGPSFGLPSSFDYDGDLAVQSDLVVNNKATSTVALWVGSGGTADNINLAGGDLYVQNDAEIDGDLWVGSVTTTDSLLVGGYASTTGDLIVGGGTVDVTTSTATTTLGLFVRTRNSTSTVSIGELESDRTPGCLEMVRENAMYHCYVDSGANFVCALGRCVD